MPDHVVLTRCIAEDRVIVTENAADFRRLVGRVELHPGLVILPSIDREGTWALLRAAIAFIEARGDPMQFMVNHVLEIDNAGEVKLFVLPAP